MPICIYQQYFKSRYNSIYNVIFYKIDNMCLNFNDVIIEKNNDMYYCSSSISSLVIKDILTFFNCLILSLYLIVRCVNDVGHFLTF